MEGGVLLETGSNGVGGLLSPGKGEIHHKKMPMVGNVLLRRARLSDITNATSNGKVGISDQGNPTGVSCTSAKDYIARLLKENTELVSLLGERNKIIEMSGIELQKVRFTLQQANQQNWHLAQANSHMLAELNLGKDRLKALQHELGCTAAVLKAKTLELEEMKKLNKQHKKRCEKIATEKERHMKLAELAADAPLQATCKNPCNPNRKRTLRSQSLGPTTVTHQVTAKEKDESRRRSLRRRSSNLKTELHDPPEDLFEIEDVKLPIRSTEDNSTPITITESVKAEAVTAQNDLPQCQTEGSHRTSLGRPLRRAAEKVSSYKEVPVNVKMRRAE